MPRAIGYLNSMDYEVVNGRVKYLNPDYRKCADQQHKVTEVKHYDRVEVTCDKCNICWAYSCGD